MTTRTNPLITELHRGCGGNGPVNPWGSAETPITGSSRFVVNDPAGAGIHATVLAALVSRMRIR